MRKRRSAGVRRGNWRAARGAGLAAALAVAAPAVASDVQLDPRPGMVGLGRSQTAVVNVVLTDPPDPDRPACRLTLSFVDALGEVLRDRAGNEVSKPVVLRANVADSLSVLGDAIVDAGEPCKSIRAVVQQAPDTGSPSCCGSLVVTNEIGLTPGRRWRPIIWQTYANRDVDPPDPLCRPVTR